MTQVDEEAKSLEEHKGLLIHVGGDTSNEDTLGIVGPVFEDNQFEFRPIVEVNPRQINIAYTGIGGRSVQSRLRARFLSY
jgi:hypothetical protein